MADTLTKSAQETNEAIATTEFQAVASAIKTYYPLLQLAATGDDGKLLLPPPEKVTDQDIVDISNEVMAPGSDGKFTPRATAIRDFLRKNKKDDYDMLDNADKIRRAAVTSVQDNTSGPMGSPSWMALFMGIITWLTNGGLNDLFNGNGFQGAIDGITKVVEQAAAPGVKSEFAQNLAKEGIQPDSDVGKKAIEQFNQKVDEKAGLRKAAAEKPFNLADVQMAGATSAADTFSANSPANPDVVQTSTSGKGARPDAASKSDRSAQIRAVFEKAGDGLKPLGKLLDTDKLSMFNNAVSQSVEVGSNLTEKAIEKGARESKDLPSNYDIVEQVFINLQKNQSNPTVDIVAAEFAKNAKNPNRNLNTIISDLKSSTDRDVSNIGGVLLPMIDKQLEGTKDSLVAIAKGNADTPGRPETAKGETPAQKEARVKLAKSDAEKSRQDTILAIKLGVENETTKPLDAALVLPQIHAMVAQSINTQYGSAGTWLYNHSWSKSLAEKAHRLPTDAEQKTLADFIAVRVPAIAGKEIIDEINHNPQSVNAGTVVENTLKQFETAFDEGIKNNTIPEVWKEHKSEIVQGLRQQLHTQKDAEINKLADQLRNASSDNLRADATPPDHNFKAMSTPQNGRQGSGLAQSA